MLACTTESRRAFRHSFSLHYIIFFFPFCEIVYERLNYLYWNSIKWANKWNKSIRIKLVIINFDWICQLNKIWNNKIKQNKLLRRPGIEPGSQEWESCMIPLHQRRLQGLEEVIFVIWTWNWIVPTYNKPSFKQLQMHFTNRWTC